MVPRIAPELQKWRVLWTGFAFGLTTALGHVAPGREDGYEPEGYSVLNEVVVHADYIDARALQHRALVSGRADHDVSADHVVALVSVLHVDARPARIPQNVIF